ncbi:MAG: M20/M25/M40 family metallo-hydrolase, partial [Gammaproteobacteria bacterium]|nr:M20/M25/M40 family metallo-hydrolase [Gammaproteobacteria bacterium]
MIFLYGLLVLLAGMLLRTLCLREPKSSASQKAPPLAFDTEAAITHLSEAIQCQTISEVAGEVTHPEAFKQLHALLEKAYPLVFERLEKEVLGEFTLLFKWPGKNPDLKPVLCIAHQDVVPVPEKEIPHWTEPPFAGNVSDGYIWGRGALDMKSSLMALFEAVNQLLISGFEPERAIYIYSGDDEEVGGPTAKKAAEHLKEAGVQFSFIIDEGGAIVDEMIPHVDAPLGLIGIGQKGVLTLELSVDGESGHSAQPTQKTPIDVLGGAVAKLKENEMPIHSQALVFKLFERLASSMPFKLRFIFSNLWLFKKLLINQLVQRPLMNAMMRTTGVPTIFNAGLKQNIVPETASVTLNYRLYPGDTKKTVLKHVNRLIKDTDIRVKV